MGCGSSDNRSVQNPLPSPRKTTIAIVPRDDSKSVWEDERIMFDSDLHREAKCVRKNKWSDTVRPCTRDKSRPDSNQGLATLLSSNTSEGSQPAGRLDLEYVYGYSAVDSRHNAFFANGETVVYPCSAIGVVLDVKHNTQRFFGGGALETAVGHSDQILCLALSPDRSVAATGEVGSNPKICLWRVDNPEAGPICEIRQGLNTVAVEVLCFSSSGQHIIACDSQAASVLRVFDCTRGTRLVEETVGTRVLEVAAGAAGFAAAGVRVLTFWWAHGKSYRSDQASYGEVGKKCSFAAVRWSADLCLAGATNGQLYVFQSAVLTKTVQVLPLGASIHALCVTSSYVYVGGNDNIVHELDMNFTELRSFPVSSCPRALDCLDDKILCGIREGSILLLSGQDERVLMEAHSDGDVRGLAVGQKQREHFISSGEDNKIKLWDCERHKCVATGLLDPKVNSHSTATSFSQFAASQQSRAVALSRTDAVAIAHNDGHVSIRKGATMLNNIHATVADAQDWIEAIAYNVDGTKLAVGSHDAMLRVYDAKGSYRLLLTLGSHKAGIVSVDWSASGQLLRSAAEDGEVLFWNANNGRTLEEEDVREEVWLTWTCKFGPQTEGVLSLVPDSKFFSAVDRHPVLPLLAVANEFGCVLVSKFPSERGARSLAYKAHSDRVTSVRWSLDGRRLFSAGGYDQCIAQWRWVPQS